MRILRVQASAVSSEEERLLPPHFFGRCERLACRTAFPPTLDNPVDDAGNWLEAISLPRGPAPTAIDYRAAQELPTVVPEAGWNVAVSIRSGEIVAVRASGKAVNPLSTHRARAKSASRGTGVSR